MFVVSLYLLVVTCNAMLLGIPKWMNSMQFLPTTLIYSSSRQQREGWRMKEEMRKWGKEEGGRRNGGV